MTKQTPADTFETVRTMGLAPPDVEATTRYDGSPVLKRGGSFMAGLATHPSAEPHTLVVRASVSVCHVDPWSTPTSLGPIVNSVLGEVKPVELHDVT